MEIRTKKTAIPEDIISIWQDIVNVVAQLIHTPSVMINRLQPPELEVFRSNLDETNPFPSGVTMPMAGVYCESAALRRERVQVVDARVDAEWSDSPTAKAGIYAYLGYPLFWPDGDVFGTICTVDTKEHFWEVTCDSVLGTFKKAIEAHLALVINLGELSAKNTELQKTLDEVTSLKGLLPICSACKKIRDDKGYWNQVEAYIAQHSQARFTHGICPECRQKHYPEIEDYWKKRKTSENK